MFDIEFYQNTKGIAPVQQYLDELVKSNSKDSRIKLNKIRDYMKILSLHGTHAGEPYIKHLDDDIWELRPLRDRILFFCWDGKRFVLLHHFVKRTQKTPAREIEQAKRNMNDYLERSNDDE